MLTAIFGIGYVSRSSSRTLLSSDSASELNEIITDAYVLLGQDIERDAVSDLVRSEK